MRANKEKERKKNNCINNSDVEWESSSSYDILPKTTKTTILVTRFLPRRDSADTLLPGALCQRRISIPT